MNISRVYDPTNWGYSYWFFEGIENKQHRRALALVNRFGTPGGGDKICFIEDYIVISSPPEPDLVVRKLDEFIDNFSISIERDADPMALRWIEKIVHWPDLGC